MRHAYVTMHVYWNGKDLDIDTPDKLKKIIEDGNIAYLRFFVTSVSCISEKG